MASNLSNICLWLDALDSTTLTLLNNQVLEWKDKSSNAASFIPVRDGFRPVWSTNAVRFTPSSFQLRSVNKLPAYSTTDLFFMMNYEPLRGPRQPFFDSADFTPCETDNRLNVQLYADGEEFFRGCPTPSTTLGGVAIYKGDLYLGTNVNMIPNYVQKYDRVNEQFNFVDLGMSTPNIRGMAVYDGRLYMAGGSTVESYDGNNSIIVTNLLSSTTNTPIVYNENLYVTTTGFITTASNAASRPQLYRWNTATSNFDGIAQMQAFLNATAAYIQYVVNIQEYAGRLYFFNSNSVNTGSITTFSGNTYDSNSLATTIHFGTGLFRGFLLDFRNEARLYRYTEAAQGFMTWARANTQNVTGFASCAYKGDMYFLKNATSGTNQIEFTGGDQSGSSADTLLSTFTATTTSLNTNSLMVVHDGKLFINNNNTFNIIQYGSGTSLDFALSTSRMLVMLRKTQEYAQVWINGTMAFETLYSFEFNRQFPRNVYVGGAAGTLCSGVSDPGTDHLRGSLQSVLQFSRLLDDSERQIVEGDLAWRFGAETLLPEDHPYRYSSP